MTVNCFVALVLMVSFIYTSFGFVHLFSDKEDKK